MTTDLVGEDPLDMKIWETVDDARKRLLTEDARILPWSFVAYTRFYRAQEDFLAAHRGREADVARWKNRYGIDFTPLVVQDDREWIGTYEPPGLANSWQPASENVFLYECRSAKVSVILRPPPNPSRCPKAPTALSSTFPPPSPSASSSARTPLLGAH